MPGAGTINNCLPIATAGTGFLKNKYYKGIHLINNILLASDYFLRYLPIRN
jgi:hypothetical protein